MLGNWNVNLSTIFISRFCSIERNRFQIKCCFLIWQLCCWKETNRKEVSQKCSCVHLELHCSCSASWPSLLPALKHQMRFLYCILLYFKDLIKFDGFLRGITFWVCFFFPLLCSVSFISWPLLSSLCQFYRTLLMKCAQCFWGRTCHSDFSLFLQPVWFHPAAAGPFSHKRTWLLSVIKMNFSFYGTVFSPSESDKHMFSWARAILRVVKTQSSQDFLFTIVQHKQCAVKETNEVFDNQFLSEMPWAEWGFSIIISCSVAIHRLLFFHLEVLILSLF